MEIGDRKALTPYYMIQKRIGSEITMSKIEGHSIDFIDKANGKYRRLRTRWNP